MTIVVPYSVESLRCYAYSIASLREEDMLSEIETIAETNKVIKQVISLTSLRASIICTISIEYEIVRISEFCASELVEIL